MSLAGFETAIAASDGLEQKVTEESKRQLEKHDFLDMYVNSRVPWNNLVSTILLSDPQNPLVSEVHRWLNIDIGQTRKEG
jgi:hypothetical protein